MEQGRTRLADIFAREKARFLRFVERQLFDLDDADAEDIVSEVTFNLLRRADVVDEVENLTAYIYRSLANRITDHRRKKVPTVRIDGQGEDETGSGEIADGRLRPDQILEQHELRNRLLAAISQLAPKERAVWIATEVEGRSFRELAEEWDEPIGTLLSRKSRAAATLRRLLSEYRAR